MDKLRIYLVDDHKLFREGLKLLLSTQDFVRHIYEASNGREFVENLSFVDCDVVLMDIEMPEMNGIDATIEAMKMMVKALCKKSLAFSHMWSSTLLASGRR